MPIIIWLSAALILFVIAARFPAIRKPLDNPPMEIVALMCFTWFVTLPIVCVAIAAVAIWKADKEEE